MRRDIWKRAVLAGALAGGCLFQNTCNLVTETIGLAMQIANVWV